MYVLCFFSFSLFFSSCWPVCFLHNILSNLHIFFFKLSEIICRSVLHMWHDLDTNVQCAYECCINVFEWCVCVCGCVMLIGKRKGRLRIGKRAKYSGFFFIRFSNLVNCCFCCAQVSACTKLSSSEQPFFFSLHFCAYSNIAARHSVTLAYGVFV